MKPLQTSFKKNGFQYDQVEREADVAVFSQTNDEHIWYEVIVVQKNPERTMAGTIIPAYEGFPGNEQWGQKGWTYGNLADARAKATKLRLMHDRRTLYPTGVLTIIIVVLFALTGCSKSATVHQSWLSVHGHDTASWSHAQFCQPGDSVGIETINLVFTGGSDENQFSLKEGSVYFPPNGRVLLQDSTFDRTYYKLLKRLQ